MDSKESNGGADRVRIWKLKHITVWRGHRDKLSNFFIKSSLQDEKKTVNGEAEAGKANSGPEMQITTEKSGTLRLY